MDGVSNKDVVVGLALQVLVSMGMIDADCAEDETEGAEVIADLRRLYDETPICQTQVRFNGDILHDASMARVGQYLVAALEVEWREQWERELPTWTCDCGAAFKLHNETISRRSELYRIDCGMLGELVGSIEGRGQGAARNRDCPDCGQPFATTIERQTAAQLSLFTPG